MNNLRKLFKVLGTCAMLAALVLSFAACDLLGGETQDKTPVAGDYDIDNLKQPANSVTAVTITPKAGRSTGKITIYYTGT